MNNLYINKLNAHSKLTNQPIAAKSSYLVCLIFNYLCGHLSHFRPQCVYL